MGSRLLALAPGPAGEAVALWRSSPPSRSRFDGGHSELWAARTFIERHGRVALRPAERVTAAGANVAASVAVDPASDRAVAAWVALGDRPRIEYATGPGSPAYRSASPSPAKGGTDWASIALIAAAAAAIMATIALAGRRRAAGRRAGRASRRTG